SAAALLVRWTRPWWTFGGSPEKSGWITMSRGRKRMRSPSPAELAWSKVGNPDLGGDGGRFDASPPGRDLVPAAELQAGRRRVGIDQHRCRKPAQLVGGHKRATRALFCVARPAAVFMDGAEKPRLIADRARKLI